MANKQHVEHNKSLFPNEIMLLNLKSLFQFYSGSHLNNKYIKVRRYIFQKILVNGKYFQKSLLNTHTHTHTHRGHE